MTWDCPSCGTTNLDNLSYCDACGTEAPAAEPTDDGSGVPEAPVSSIDLVRIECTGCGSAMDIASGAARGQATCGSCGSVLDLSTPEYRVLSKLIVGGYKPKSKLEVGLEGEFDGVLYRIMGRLRYSQPDCFWDEWFLVAADGTICYLEEDDGDFRLLRPFTPSDAPVRSDLEDATKSSLTIDGDRYNIVERGTASIEYFEGQIAWRVKAGTTVQFIDARGADGRLSIEWTKRELEFFRGTARSVGEIGSAFGVSPLFPPSYSASSFVGGDASMPASSIMILAFVLIFFVIVFSMADCGSCNVGRGGGHYSSGGFGGK
jgi:ribosomal protein S27E